ncbi:caspase domain-containing protein, partial [Leptodontidium sp. MPI-SDFR-AT-0119]
MGPTKWALLIGSPQGGLRGPLTDVSMMSSLFLGLEFAVLKCCGPDATCDGIKSAWRNLISHARPDDTIVIYYSGHGGLAKSSSILSQGTAGTKWSSKPHFYQFIVPVDYAESTASDFNGITDVELSHLLRDTTTVTANVTIIFDCCHSAHMSRDPSHISGAVSRAKPTLLHFDIETHIERLKKTGKLQGETFLEGNPYAVRLAAAATTEAAWEYKTVEGQYVGAFTEALAAAIKEAEGKDVSWRTLLGRVCEQVNSIFPSQHPQVEGPDTRTMFFMRSADSQGQLIKMEDDGVHATIQAGRIAGVQEGNVYAVMPFGADRIQREAQVATAEVISISGFEARATVSFRPGHTQMPPQGALAFLQAHGLYRWPVSVNANAADAPAIYACLTESKFIRPCAKDEMALSLASIDQNGACIVLRNSQKVQLSSRPVVDDKINPADIKALVHDTETLARAQHLLALQGGTGVESLQPILDIDFGLVNMGSRRPLPSDGTAIAEEDDRVYMSLCNCWEKNTVFVSVFDVLVTGLTTLISASRPMGIELGPGEDYTLGADQHGFGLRGLRLNWPENVPRLGAQKGIPEILVVVVSTAPVDLR